ncbi:MAG: type III secretion system chaperone [Candidatus Lokiarchaeota archaeon]|nr:type III secretion system chaperone [Candidatus Lokiarchaeota archaeon]
MAANVGPGEGPDASAPAPVDVKTKTREKKLPMGPDTSTITTAAEAQASSELDYTFFENVKLSIDKKKYFERPIATEAELKEIRSKMDEDVRQAKQLMARLEGYLRGRVDAISINKKQFEIMIPIEYMSLKFTTILSIHPQWVFIKCKVMDLEEIPDKIRHELYERLLVANFELNAVFYSVDPDFSAIWVENDLAVVGLDLNAFEIKFNAIIFGIRYFVDSIALPLNQEMKSTFDATGMYT